MLLVSWLTAPWRVARGLLTDLASVLAGRQTQRGVLVAVVVGLAVAVTRTLQQDQWMAGGLLIFLGLAAVLVPVADAAISRRAEFAADRFAADHGLALELTTALHALEDGQSATSGWLQRLLASHPTSEQRIDALLPASAAPPSDGDSGMSGLRPRRRGCRSSPTPLHRSAHDCQSKQDGPMHCEISRRVRKSLP